MGRMKRQRRYKSCDPFANKKKDTAKESKFDQPPKKNEDDDQTRKFKRFMGIQNSMSKKKVKKNKNGLELDKSALRKSSKKLKAKQKGTNMEKLSNESKREYFERLDQNVQDAINTTMMEAKTLRKKRKIHLKARSEKLKLKKKNSNEADFNTLEDTVKFGETVDAPPTITAAPRKTPTTSNKFQGLKLMSIIDKNGEKESKDNKKKLDEQEKADMDVERQRVIDAYRLMKKRKEARYAT